jgi:cell division septation protein DedD
VSPRPPTRSGWAIPLLALVVATAGAAGPAGLAAQVPTLDRVDSLVAAGRYGEARGTLEEWWSARDRFDVPGSDRARALMLRARLAPDPETAEPDYLAVVLGYPTSEHAPEALLRLGQGLLATGEATRSAAYLERLVADYPGRPQRVPALLWLARAQTAARRPAAACTAARTGLRDTRDPDITAMLRVEESASCAVGSRDVAAGAPDPAPTPTQAAPDPAPARDDPADPPVDAPAEPPAAPAAGPGVEWGVQTGAFRYQEGADALMARLREAGYEPRLVLVPANTLMRVRVGRFATAQEAGRLLARLEDDGFAAYVVRDVARERERSP